VTERVTNTEMWELFSCHRCGKCCSELGLPYDPFKIHDIANFLGISVEDVISTYYGKPAGDGKHWIPDDAKRKPCPFLTTDGSRKSCRIYPVRPEGCRAPQRQARSNSAL
jgi:Fe-S-cluster containining protein